MANQTPAVVMDKYVFSAFSNPMDEYLTSYHYICMHACVHRM